MVKSDGFAYWSVKEKLNYLLDYDLSLRFRPWSQHPPIWTGIWGILRLSSLRKSFEGYFVSGQLEISGNSSDESNICLLSWEFSSFSSMLLSLTCSSSPASPLIVLEFFLCQNMITAELRSSSESHSAVFDLRKSQNQQRKRIRNL